MPRPERPVDPGADEVQRFAFELRQLREKAAKPTYRRLAARTEYSLTALSEAAGGREFPSLAVTLAFVRACGGERAEWEARWRDAAHRVAGGFPGADPPYRGLAAFGVEDAGLFFGREALAADVVKRVCAQPFVAVFGASGSGKSSLLRAGVVPAFLGGTRRCAMPWDPASRR